jgi:hypothetical protein
MKRGASRFTILGMLRAELRRRDTRAKARERAVFETLDGIAGAYGRAELGLRQAPVAETIALDDL